jgi:hypothetical protein
VAQLEVSNACSVTAAHLNIRLFLIAQGPSANKILQFTGKASNDTLCYAYPNTGKLYRNSSSQYVHNKNNFPVPLQKLADKKIKKFKPKH